MKPMLSASSWDPRPLSSTVSPAALDLGSGRFQVQICAAGHRNTATVLESSGNDLRCVMSCKVRLGEVVEVVFPSFMPTVDVNVPAVIHWVRRDGDRWRVGLCMKYPAPNEFLMRYRECRRDSVRYECCVRGVVSWSSSDSSTEAIVVNYCGDGICMMMPVIPRIGELFRFAWNDPSFPQDTADLTMRTVFGCIRWTGDGEQGTLAGSELPAGMGYLFSGVDTQGLLAMIADE